MRPSFKIHQMQESEHSYAAKDVILRPFELIEITSAFRGARHLWNPQQILEFQPVFRMIEPNQSPAE
jgi:hypothetical protein